MSSGAPRTTLFVWEDAAWRGPCLDVHTQPLLLGGSPLLRRCVSGCPLLGAGLRLPHPLLPVCKRAPVHRSRARRDEPEADRSRLVGGRKFSFQVAPRLGGLCAYPPPPAPESLLVFGRHLLSRWPPAAQCVLENGSSCGHGGQKVCSRPGRG